MFTGFINQLFSLAHLEIGQTKFQDLDEVNIYRKTLQCEAPKIAKLVYNSNNYGLWYL